MLDPAQTAAIVHLVASSVPELMPANVTVVDQAGNLISDQNKNGSGGLNAKNMDETQLKYVKDMQTQIIKQVESIIVPIVGEGNVRAEATADVDFSRSSSRRNLQTNSRRRLAIRTSKAPKPMRRAGQPVGIPGHCRTAAGTPPRRSKDRGGAGAVRRPRQPPSQCHANARHPQESTTNTK